LLLTIAHETESLFNYQINDLRQIPNFTSTKARTISFTEIVLMEFTATQQQSTQQITATGIDARKSIPTKQTQQTQL
jgi:hypothetical protein